MKNQVIITYLFEKEGSGKETSNVYVSDRGATRRVRASRQSSLLDLAT